MKPDLRNRGQKLMFSETEFHQKENGSIGNTNQKRKEKGRLCEHYPNTNRGRRGTGLEPT